MGYTVDFNDEENDDLVVTIDEPLEPEGPPPRRDDSIPSPDSKPGSNTDRDHQPALDYDLAKATAARSTGTGNSTRIIAGVLFALVVVGFLAITVLR